MMNETDRGEGRVAVLAPVGRDGQLACAVLGGAGVGCQECRTMDELCRAVSEGVSALLLTEEAFDRESLESFLRQLDREPAWSDLPVVLLLTPPARLPTELEALSRRRSVSILERPVRPTTLVTSMRTALRARERQYEVRDLLSELEYLNKHLERRVDERTAELADVNRELEAFSYSISHDLRSPLRAIDGFSQVILDDYADRFDERLRGYFARIREAARRMGTLIDELLKLSRLTRGEIRKRTVNLSAVAQGIARDLLERHPERIVSFDIPPGMMAYGDEDLLRIALHNLLENAWKFTARTEEARIVVGRRVGEDVPTFFVSDNGAGFNMRYADRLFTPFQRLHQNTEFEGTGIGLAIVNRIVRRHGGRTWAEASPGRGAVFYFTVPDSPAT